MMSAGRLRLRPLSALLAAVVLLLTSWLIVTPDKAAADGPTTFTNSTSIAVPAVGSPDQIGVASPYPSPIEVAGMSGAVTKVTVTFHGLNFSAAAGDVDALVVAPNGANLLVMSDVGPANSLVTANNATVTFDDAGASQLTSATIASGTYRPTNNSDSPADSFPGPAPTPSSNTTLAGAFTGLASANGTWQLFIVDDVTGDTGTVTGGWSLAITTETAAVATTTAVTSSDASTLVGESVTFTATVAAGGSPVTAGTVQFADGATNLGAPVAVNNLGVATFTTSALTEGTHQIPRHLQRFRWLPDQHRDGDPTGRQPDRRQRQHLLQPGVDHGAVAGFREPVPVECRRLGSGRPDHQSHRDHNRAVSHGADRPGRAAVRAGAIAESVPAQ